MICCKGNCLFAHWLAARWLCCLLVIALVLVEQAHAGTPLHPMVPMFHKWQMEAAPAVVDKVAGLGHKRVQFCVTLQTRLKSGNQLESIGLFRDSKPPGGPNAYFPIDPEVSREVSGYLNASFAKAVAHHMEISVLLHLNSHGDNQMWRNDFDFDPLVPLAGVSYQDGFFRIVMEALESSLPSDHPVEISVQGEMGTTVFLYPDSWRKLIETARSRGKLRKARFGVSFNYQGIAGKAEPAAINKDALKRLWDVCDFIGVSMYQAVSHPPVAHDFDLAVGLFAGEFYGLGCPLPVDKPLHFVEVGIGGGGQSPKDWQPDVPAENPADAARAPYLGSSDIAKANPWADASLRALRVGYHKELCSYLANTRPRYPVKRAFLWSYGSWDLMGLEESRFADPEIIRLIDSHNHSLDASGP